ncbi:EAL domain-containing protein [Vibrio sonorensis]|uniref:EAL domain-containing protein n=1 Tax=Vibrio sonorensis TaxID=1004316 RepID=UPI000AAE6C1D|nr:EAL domain-containing protein [Vibrio sonorensis]
MKNLSDQIEAMSIAYTIVDKDFSVKELSPQASDLFRVARDQNLFQSDIKFVDENFSYFDLLGHLKQAISVGLECHFELGISYPDRNVEWVRLSLIAYKGAYLIQLVDISELVAARRLNKQLSMQDPHTGLFYREAFLAKINEEHDHGLVCCVRICNYQRINEIWGTAVANLVFMEILARVSNEIEGAVCSKHSTDSFNIFIPKDFQLDVESFYSLLNEPFHFNGRHFFSNVALGYYVEEKGDNHEQSLNKAEMAILDVLSERVRLAEFQEDLAKQIEHQNNLETEFRAAVSKTDLQDDFFVVFQPIHDSETEKIAGAECLIRWTLNGNFISPMEFIPIAEKIGDIGVLTQFNITS